MRRWPLILLALILVGFGAPRAEAFKGTVTIALSGEPLTMDPHRETDFIGTMVWPWVTDRLVTTQLGTGKIVPWLAEKFERLDAKRTKMTLRKDAKFFDGSPVTSEAVQYSIGRILDPQMKSRQRSLWNTFDRVEILDERTFILHNKVPDNGLLNRFLNWGQILSPKSRTLDPAAISRNPLGSGPYMVKELVKGQRTVFEANPNWWGNSLYPNRPKTVILRRIQEATTRIKALETGEVDVITGVPHHFIPEIKKHAGLEVAAVPAVRILFIGFFTRFGGPFGDVKVRQAVNHAIDAEKIRTTLLGGYADIFHQLLHPWNYAGYNPDKRWYGYDPAKAKQLMKEAGYEKGFRAEFITTNGRYPADRETCEAVAGMLRDIQVQTTCSALAFPLFRKTFTAYQNEQKKGAAMYYMGWGNGSGEAGLVLRGSTSCKGSFSGSCFPDLDGAIEKAATTADPKEQQAAFERVTDLMKEKASHKVMFKIHDIFGFNKRLNFQPRHDEQLQPWEISLK
ncbi:MAG: hypothetical protein HYZ11_04260 [Candidatus Tectomicrobia bacterium]|uniref:Solute-binding protein family 5 domain-containing protein n=1 Tax=Tectimicrobiota bacterium TaxID=2528274 RepID=A0A932I016_UNCTE|nr:hypothetical protein [Candidatus Tectomicrobia bacterium]